MTNAKSIVEAFYRQTLGKEPTFTEDIQGIIAVLQQLLKDYCIYTEPKSEGIILAGYLRNLIKELQQVVNTTSPKMRKDTLYDRVYEVVEGHTFTCGNQQVFVDGVSIDVLVDAVMDVLKEELQRAIQ